MTNLVCLDCIEDLFTDRNYVYFLTIKPDQRKVDKIFELFIYLDKRVAYYWLVKCKSTEGYVHFHGIITFYNGLQCMQADFLKKAIHRKVNRCIGFLYPLEQLQSVVRTYNYIRCPKNIWLAEYLKDQKEGYCRMIVD